MCMTIYLLDLSVQKLLIMIEKNPLDSFRFCPQCGTEGFANYDGRAKRCTSCGLTYYHNTASAVACLVRNTHGQYLFVRRAHEPAKGTLDLPGGFADPLETVEQTVVREIAEETGLSARQIRYLTSRPNVYPYSGIDVYTSDLFFVVEVDSFDGATAQDDAAEIVIARLDEIRAEDFGLSSIRGFIEEVLARPNAFAELW